jgi:hypothetical protein
VGEANVVSKMLEVKALLGGEGNGGVIVLDNFITLSVILNRKDIVFEVVSPASTALSRTPNRGTRAVRSEFQILRTTNKLAIVTWYSCCSTGI